VITAPRTGILLILKYSRKGLLGRQGEALATRVEDRIDQEIQPGLARSSWRAKFLNGVQAWSYVAE
jgi:hypothetical protein